MASNKVRMTFVFKIKDFTRTKALNVHKKLLKKFGERHTSEYSSYTPHITIHQAEFPEKNEEEVLRLVQKIVEITNRIVFIPIGISSKKRYVAVNFKKTPAIAEFQEVLIKNLNPFREGALKDMYRESFRNFEGDEQENIQSWGYPYIFDSYSPHLTLISLEKIEDAPEATKMIHWEQDFEVRQVEIVVSKEGVFERVVSFDMK